LKGQDGKNIPSDGSKTK
jgi:hypothetical protein